MFPVWLNLEGRACLVVGAGGVALRKVLSLLEAGARLTVVAPAAVPALEALAAEGRLVLERRAYRAGEAGEGYAVVFAATDQREVNGLVSRDAAAANVFVNVADDPELCSFTLPARVRRGPLEIAVASGGGAPFLVRRLRQVLEGKLGPQWAEWADAAAAFRTIVRRESMTPDQQEACFDRFVDETLDRDRLQVRVPSEDERQRWLPDRAEGDGRRDGVREEGGLASSDPAAPPSRFGLVSLVGAGPGCAGLLTLRGRDRLLAADAIVYDRLAVGALPTDIPAPVELHGVGKEAGHHPVPQEQINALLVRLAGEGKRVVRFKGGDPYVFGRGSEEAEALRAHGIPFEVVSGVTSGVGALAAAGIPVTHRQEAVHVTLLTAHECAKAEGPQVRWDLFAQDPHGTLVGYMGVTAVPGVVERLLAAGMSPDTPAALVEQGTTSSQRSIVTTLAGLPAAVRQGVNPPALFVIGPTVRRATALDWCAGLPLFGERIAVPAEVVPVARALEAAGAEVVPVPFPITPAARLVLGARRLTGCVVRTPEEVESLDEECSGPGWDGTWIARARGWLQVEVVGLPHEALIVDAVAGRRRLAAAPS